MGNPTQIYTESYQKMVGEYMSMFSNYEGLLNVFIIKNFFKDVQGGTQKHEDFFEEILFNMSGNAREELCLKWLKRDYNGLYAKIGRAHV